MEMCRNALEQKRPTALVRQNKNRKINRDASNAKMTYTHFCYSLSVDWVA